LTTVSLRTSTTGILLTSGVVDLVSRALTTLLSVMVARALAPADVGVLGLAIMAVGLVSLVGFAFEGAAMAADPRHPHEAVALAGCLLRGGVVGAVVWAGTAAFPTLGLALALTPSDSAALRRLAAVLALVLVAEWIGTYPQVVLQRRLDLRPLPWFQLAQAVVSVTLAIGALATGHGALGLVWASVMGSTVACGLAWLWLVRSGLGRGLPTRATLQDVAGGGGRLLVGSLGGYAANRIDNLLVAGSLGAAAMSFYAMAWNASRMPTLVAARAMNAIFLPTLVRIRMDPERLDRAWGTAVRLTYLALAPLSGVLFVAGEDAVMCVLGARWLPMVPVLRVMSFTMLLAPLLALMGLLPLAWNRGHLAAVSTTPSLAVIVLLLPPLAGRWGVVGAAWADLVVSVAGTGAMLVALRSLPLRLTWDLAAIARPVLAAALAAAAATAAALPFPPGWARLVAEVGVSLGAYPLALVALRGSGDLRELWALLEDAIRRPRAAPQESR
jgi:O-antigen/teichoic acid export membrane protein